MEADESSTSAPEVKLQILPYITVQHDLQEVIQDVADGTIGAEPFWVSVYREGSTSVHGKVLAKASMEKENQVDLEAQGDIDFERQTSSSFLVGCSDLNVPKTTLKMPTQTHKSLISKGIDCMDVSLNGNLYVVGGHDGALRLGNVRTNAPEDIRLLKGHVGDILSCRFFPSSEVVISTSSDLSARIFSALDGSNPRTLKGHTAAVTDVAIIERGRNVLTTSNDGTLRLWQVASSDCLKTWRFGHGSRKRALKVAVFAKAASADAAGNIDADLQGKAAVVCLEDGSLAIVDLEPATETPIQTIQVSPTGKALTALAVTRHDNATIIATGSSDGVVTILSANDKDLGEPAEILLQFKRNSADITSLVFAGGDDTNPQTGSIPLLASSMDGLLFQAAINLSENEASAEVETEYAGYDIDACNAVVQRGSDLYAAGKDGHLKRY